MIMKTQTMLKRLKLSNAELDRIAEAVSKAESKTTGEIKIVLAPESAHYAFWELLAAVCASAVVFAFLLPFAGKITDTYALFAWTERIWMLPAFYGFICFVSIAALGNDYYDFIERRYEIVGMFDKASFRLGEPITVKVKNVNKMARTIDFVRCKEDRKNRKGKH